MKKTKKMCGLVLFTFFIVTFLFSASAFAATAKTPGKVTLTKISSSAYNKVTVSWKKAENATSYVIYYKKSGASSWKKLASVASSKTSYTHTASTTFPIVIGQKYTYTVRSYNSKWKTYSAFSPNTLTIHTLPNKVKLGTPVLQLNNTVKINWNKTSGCSHYVIYRKNSASGKWTKLGTVKKDVYSYIDTAPVSGKENIYTVRGYYSKTKVYGNYDQKGVTIIVLPNAVTGLTLNKTSVKFTAFAETVQLKATITPVSSKPTLTWTSSNERIAIVDQNGLVTAIGAGTCVITVSTKDGRVSASCSISCSFGSADITSILLSHNYLVITSKEPRQKLNAYFQLGHGENPQYTWTSSNKKVATIDQSGYITPVSNGECTITCTAKNNPSVKASCNVYISIMEGSQNTRVTANGVTFDMSKFPFAITVGQNMHCLSVKPDRTIEPKDITYVIGNGKIKTICTSSTPNLYKESGEKYIKEYNVSHWQNMLAYVKTSYHSKTTPNYRVEITSQLVKGTFPISVYYKGTLLRTCNVVIPEANEKEKAYRAWQDELEMKAWKTGMGPIEKLCAISDYISSQYSYKADGFHSNEGAKALLYAARDLGLKARYRFIGPNLDYSAGYGDVYYHSGNKTCNGKVCTVVTFGNEEYIFEAQGH